MEWSERVAAAGNWFRRIPKPAVYAIVSLLVLAPCFWQPRLEEMRGALAVALATRVVITRVGEDAGTRALVATRGRAVELPVRAR